VALSITVVRGVRVRGVSVRGVSVRGLCRSLSVSVLSVSASRLWLVACGLSRSVRPVVRPGVRSVVRPVCQRMKALFRSVPYRVSVLCAK